MQHGSKTSPKMCIQFLTKRTVDCQMDHFDGNKMVDNNFQ